MEDKVVTEKYLDARLDALESRTDVKLKDLEISITSKMNTKIDSNLKWMLSTMIAMGAAIIAAVVYL